MKKGFTLIEILLAIALISTLTLLVMPVFFNMFKESSKNAFLSEAINLLETAKSENLTKETLLSNNNFCYSDSTHDNKLELINKEGLYYDITIENNYVVTFKISNNNYYMQVHDYFGVNASDLKNAQIFSRSEESFNKVSCDLDYEPTSKDCFVFDTSTGVIMGYDNLNEACTSDVRIPNKIEGVSVTTIGEMAFWSTGITDVVIPNSVVEIQMLAFSENLLSNIEIPNSVTTIGSCAFQNNQLISAIIPNSITTIEDCLFLNNQLISISIPRSVTTIGSGAFQNNQLTSVTIPDSVTTIGSAAFRSNQISHINIPSSVINIGAAVVNNNLLPDNQAFIYLRNVDGSPNTNTIVSYGGAKRANVIIPANVTTLISSSFIGNYISSITLPNSLTTIKDHVFTDNSLNSISIPDSVTTIGNNTFHNNQLNNIEMQGSSTTIGSNVLTGTNNNFRTAYQSGGAGTYVGTQEGTWTKQ